MRSSNYPIPRFNPPKRFGRRFSETLFNISKRMSKSLLYREWCKICGFFFIKIHVNYVDFLSSGVRPEWGIVLWFQSDIPLKLFIEFVQPHLTITTYPTFSIPNNLIFEDQNYLGLKSHILVRFSRTGKMVKMWQLSLFWSSSLTKRFNFFNFSHLFRREFVH